MLPRRCGPGRYAPAPRLAVPVVVAWALSIPSAGLALDLEIGRPRESGGRVWMDVRVTDVLPSRVEESLARGMPATLDFHVELWRRRRAWFDRHENSYDASIKIRYRVWSDVYRLEWKGLPTEAETVPSLDSLRLVLERPRALPVQRVGLLRPGSRYFIVVSATLKPLSVEDIAEGEGWLSGEVENKRRAGLGIVTAIPRSVFDAVRNFTGFGDKQARAMSEDFQLDTLFSPP